MELTSSNSFVSLLVLLSPPLLLLLLLHLFRRPSKGKRLPPGPPGWPIIGNIFDLGPMPHRDMAELRQKYGPVVWLQFGAVKTMVILSAKAATEFFRKHDLSFVDRTVRELMRVHDYDKGSLALAPYGPHWRVLRRLTTVDMVVAKRINETASVRRKCVDNMILWIEEEARGVGERRGVHVARFVFLMSFNMLGNLMLSRDLVNPKSEKELGFFTSMQGLMEWPGYANMADLFPWLRWLDLQGLKRKMKLDMGNAMRIASGFVKERLSEEGAAGENRTKDFLDVLLEFVGDENDGPSKITDRDLNIFILEIFMAGSETTSSSIEWAMTELLCNPESMIKANSELDRVIGPNRKLEEADLENLQYLQAIIKETLRLHPPIPLLVPRRAIHDTKFMGFDIPKDTQVFVNAWAIGRDPNSWDDPLCFRPERFLDSNVEYKGQNYEFIPFGAGRRMCAGVPLAHRVLNLVLGSLLHHFEWELEENVTPATMDMKDRKGITVRKFEPMKAIPKNRVRSGY